MEKTNKDFSGNKGEFESRRREHRFHNEEYKPRSRKNVNSLKIVETKLFVSKEELVEYVNIKGQGSSTIEIFKIEDGLYKLVIKE